MVVKCFVPGCKTCHKSNQERKSKGERILYFFKPRRDEKELAKWYKSLLRVDRELKTDVLIKPSFRICELHFNEDDIQRFYEHKLTDGTVWRMEKGRVALKKGAVPTVFPSLQTTSNERKSQKHLNSTKKCSKKENISSDRNLECSKSTLNENPEDSCLTENVEKENSTETILSEMPETSCDNALVNNLLQLPNPDLLPETFSYNVLANNLEHISKPDLLWGITVHDEYVMCARWNEDSTLMKRVIVDNSLTIQVFLKNRRIDFDNVKINSIEDLSSILLEVNRYGICRNIDDVEKAECDGYILPDDGYILPDLQRNQCEYCRLIGNWEINQSKESYWLSKGRNFTKHQKLYQRIHALNKQNILLKEQIQRMIEIKTIWKHSNLSDKNLMKR